jgi:TonB family protein
MDGLMLRFKWGEQRLHSALLRQGESFTVGSAKGVDFACAEVSGLERFELARDLKVRFARGMHGTFWRGEDALTLSQAVECGAAVDEGDGYVVELARADALRLELGSLCVEALPVRVPERVPVEPLESLDLRMLNVLGIVFIAAMICIASAIANEGGGDGLGDDLGPSKALTRFVLPQAPPKPSRGAAKQVRKEPASREGRAPPAAKTVRPGHAKDVAQQVGQALQNAFAGGSDTSLRVALSGLQANSAFSSQGMAGMGLRGDASGGGGGSLIGLGGIHSRGRGGGEGTYGGGVGIIGGKTVTEVVGIGTEVTVIGLDKELIRKVIHQHRSEVRFCYELALTKNPQLRGKTSVKFVITGSGSVSSASIAASTQAELDDCVSSRVRTWVFPKPPGGGTAVVTYPFVFEHN